MYRLMFSVIAFKLEFGISCVLVVEAKCKNEKRAQGL